MLVNREHLNKIRIQKTPFSTKEIKKLEKQVLDQYLIEKKDLSYLLFSGQLTQNAYNQKQSPIKLLTKSGDLIEFAKASDRLNIEALSQPVVKYYLSYPSLSQVNL